MVQPRKASVAIVGAGDFIGSAIARRFAREGYQLHLARRDGTKLDGLVAEIAAAGGRASAHSVDARSEEAVAGFLAAANEAAPLALVVFNIGANVNFPILDTTERVFRKVWEMACYAGFLTGREAARHLLANGGGSIFFTGATASLRGGSGYAAFASAKFGLRAVAQSMARELGPKNIHVAHLVIDSAVDTAWVRERIAERTGAPPPADRLMDPDSIAEAYWQLHRQPRDAWTHELDLRPAGEPGGGDKSRWTNQSSISTSAASMPISPGACCPASSSAPGRASSRCRCCSAASSRRRAIARRSRPMPACPQSSPTSFARSTALSPATALTSSG
jgi:NAD(P)-dependent dehydrogenase (short-subunit alcohol dehydrogenase family)